MSATLQVERALNNQSSRRGIFERYSDVLEAETIPTEPAETLEAAHRIFLRQMSNARLRKLRRTLINIKRYGSVGGR